METKIRVERHFFLPHLSRQKLEWNKIQSQDHPTYPNSNSKQLQETKSLFYMEEGVEKKFQIRTFFEQVHRKGSETFEMDMAGKEGGGEVGFSISSKPSSSARNSCPCRVRRRGVHYVNKNIADAIPGINSVITCRGMAGIVVEMRRLNALLLPGAGDC